MTVQKYDLKTFSKVITTNPTSLGLGAVPSFMRRWVTFLRAENLQGVQQKLWIVSVATETYASTPARATLVAKERLLIQAAGVREIPLSGPTKTERPLFSIAADKYLNALTSHGSVAVFGQYYEE